MWGKWQEAFVFGVLGIWVLGFKAVWSRGSLQPIFKFDGSSEADILSVIVAFFAKQISFNLVTCVSDCDEIISIFLPPPNILGWTWTSNCAVCGVVLEAFTSSQLTLASWAQNPQLPTSDWDQFEKLRALASSDTKFSFYYFITAINRIKIIFLFKYHIRFMMLFYRNNFWPSVFCNSYLA